MQKNIESVEYFSCGCCVNDLSKIFKGVNSEKRTFYSGVFLIKHRYHGYILYDTGYNNDINGFKFNSLLYRMLNPTFVNKEDEIDAQLLSRNISPLAIKQVIVSHLHPDHIGRLKVFENATFWVTKELLEAFHHLKVKDLVFKRYLPEDFFERLRVFEPNSQSELFSEFKTDSAFSDDSLLVTSLDGHAKGQLAVFLPEWHLMIAADACWGVDLLEKQYRINFVAGLIQNNKSDYLQVMDQMRHLLAKKYYLVVSHDKPSRILGVLEKAKQYLREQDE